MKKYYFIALLILPLFGNAQNLIINGSFEEMRSCPIDYNMQTLNTIENWRQVAQGTPDYFNECSKRAGVPDNLFGTVEAQDGKGYAGFVNYSRSQRNYREYLQSKLKRPLSKGEEICVEYYISTAQKSQFICDGAGIYFSKKKISTKAFNNIDVKPQIHNLSDHMLDSFGTWVKISDTFIAKGGEEYITIGNFVRDQDMTKLKRNSGKEALGSNPWSYLYIDNVIVKPVTKREDCSCVNDLIAKSIVSPPLELKEIENINIQSIYFGFDEHTITDSAKIEMQQTLEMLYSNKNIFIKIIGHTDNIGKEYYNEKLSQERSESIIRYFVDKGIDEKRIQQKYFGSTKPVKTNQTKEGRAENRRVEFHIVINKYELVD